MICFRKYKSPLLDLFNSIILSQFDAATDQIDHLELLILY